MPQETSSLIPVGAGGGYSYQLKKIMNFLLLIKQDLWDKDYIYTIDDEDYATLILYYGKGIDIKVPPTIGGVLNSQYPVKYIESTCFNYNTNIHSVILPPGIVYIG